MARDKCPKCGSENVALCTVNVYEFYPDSEPFESGEEEDLDIQEPTEEAHVVAQICTDCRYLVNVCVDEPDRDPRLEALRKFVAAYDAWAASDELCGGPLFDAMLAARDALTMTCGHPISAIAGDGSTHWCQGCAELAGSLPR